MAYPGYSPILASFLRNQSLFCDSFLIVSIGNQGGRLSDSQFRLAINLLLLAGVFLFPCFGTPPRVWGKPVVCVNKSIFTSGTPPRVWGKLLWDLNRDLVTCGTPPRVWGKRSTSSPTFSGTKVHPHACGENSGFLTGSPAALKVHPHACGENSVL